MQVGDGADKVMVARLGFYSHFIQFVQYCFQQI